MKTRQIDNPFNDYNVTTKKIKSVELDLWHLIHGKEVFIQL